MIAMAALALLPMAPHAQNEATGITRVAWLQGCWESVTPQRAIEEQWTAPRGTSMLGMGRTVRGTQLIDYELMVVREDGERLAYEAHPAGQASTVFGSMTVSPTRVIFENPEHDFPQQVGYEAKSAGGLVAWIAGTEKGVPRRVEFVYRRTRCGP